MAAVTVCGAFADLDPAGIGIGTAPVTFGIPDFDGNDLDAGAVPSAICTGRLECGAAPRSFFHSAITPRRSKT
ncbi:MAG: hypothetical protein M3Y13_05065, partial [Armatimonadota bacterium]|nr:hypothetical protein [Armatimonadota bacterium]